MSDHRVLSRSALTYAALPLTVTMGNIAIRVPEALDALNRYLASRGVEPAGPSLIRYTNPHPDRQFRIEVGWVVDEGQWIEAPYVSDALPAGDYVVAGHDGPLSALGDTTTAAIAWAAERDIEFDLAGEDSDTHWTSWYELYLNEPYMGADGLQGTVEICLLTKRP